MSDLKRRVEGEGVIKTNRFKQHIPAFIDMDRPDWIPFKTTADLLNLDVVKRYSIGETPPYHFAMSDNLLMIISDSGFRWWVVGYIEKPLEIELPQWEGWKFRAILPNGKLAILSNDEVISSCGDLLTLRDGTTARKMEKEWN